MVPHEPEKAERVSEQVGDTAPPKQYGHAAARTQIFFIVHIHCDDTATPEYCNFVHFRVSDEYPFRIKIVQNGLKF